MGIFDRMVRKPEAIKADLVTRSDGSVVTKQGCTIYFPTRFIERNLAEVGVETLCVGLFPIALKDQTYGLVSITAMLDLNPSRISQVSDQDMEYQVLHFDPGSIVIKSSDVVQNDVILYRLYDELFAKGKIPWYVGYEDLANLYDTAEQYAGSSVGRSPDVIQLLTSLISRSKDDKMVYYRQVIDSREDLVKNPPFYIPLRSVNYAATNTVNKLAGSYFADGVVSALLHPSDRVETIEKILRA